MKKIILLLGIIVTIIQLNFVLPVNTEITPEFDTLFLKMPQDPIATGAMEIERKPGSPEEAFNAEFYSTTKKVLAFWKSGFGTSNHVTSFYVFEKVEDDGQQYIQIVPFQQNQKFQQIAVVWNSISPKLLSFATRKLLGTNEAFIEQMSKEPDLKWDYPDPLFGPNVKDPFDAAQIAKQEIFSSKDFIVLYNYRPIVDAHILILAKDRNCKTFADLSPEAFQQAHKIARMITAKLRQEGQEAYINHANGSISGQTVPRWHMHIIIGSRYELCKGYLCMIGKMLNLSRSLSDADLQNRIKFYKEKIGRLESEQV